MGSKIRLDSAYTASDWRLASELVQKRAPDERPDTGPTLLITLLLSLALWAGIWGVVGSLAATYCDSLVRPVGHLVARASSRAKSKCQPSPCAPTASPPTA